MNEQERIARVKRFMEQEVVFNRHLGFQVRELRPGYASCAIPFAPHLIGDPNRPALHGGLLSTLADAAGGTALWADVGLGDRISTIDLRMDFLRPGPAEDLICNAQVVRVGNRVGVVEMVVVTECDRETAIATGKGVYSIKRG